MKPPKCGLITGPTPDIDSEAPQFDPAESWTDAVVRLARSSTALDPNVAAFGQEVAELAVVLVTRRGSPNNPLG